VEQLRDHGAGRDMNSVKPSGGDPHDLLERPHEMPAGAVLTSTVVRKPGAIFWPTRRANASVARRPRPKTMMRIVRAEKSCARRTLARRRHRRSGEDDQHPAKFERAIGFIATSLPRLVCLPGFACAHVNCIHVTFARIQSPI